MKLTRLQVSTLVGYCTIGVVCGTLVYNALAVPVRGASDNYVLEFTDVEGLNPGNPVTLSGVRVGRVDAVDVADTDDGRALARVTVEVERGRTLPMDVEASVRYGDMLGARYVALTLPDEEVPAGSDGTEAGVPAESDGTEVLEPGGVVPVSQTTPPIDLTALMNGFRPLFESLPPQEVNVLARNVVDTFNGRGDAVARFLDRVAVLSTQLGDREHILGEVTANMNRILGSLDNRHDELRDLTDGLAALSASVVGDGQQLAVFLDTGAQSVSALADTIADSQGAFTRSLQQFGAVTDQWIASTPEFERMLAGLPAFADNINHTGQYGSFISLYLCNFTLKAGDAEVNIFGPTHSPVCS
ncbi:virulence factor Mce [Rhodococcus pyridinivorans KG-16]|uniref:Virulence factor Mce n=1 Tax=Rhodococcus pyridinivorans KG-16 TaxID=1441730 RepID=A0A0V9UGB1_9NOCA|nr:MlaD family protein [Rhodococcus pyridinivorans]KSZ57048.1 virulence factor Mce [Rhodococcus pyridinivorans KG-16]